jgi:hypothetical protein
MVYIPTLGMVDKGFYRGIEPVAVVQVSRAEDLHHAFAETFARGNPKVPNLRSSQWPPPVVLKYAGVKTWNAFARNASHWTIANADNLFQIIGYQSDGHGGWDRDKDKVENFPADATEANVIDRMIAILQEAAEAARH